MAFAAHVLFLDGSGNTVYDTDAANVVGLSYSFKLPGGCALCTFRLVGDMLGRIRWSSGQPDAREILIVDPAGLPDTRITQTPITLPDGTSSGTRIPALWRGRFVSVTPDSDARTYTMTYAGYWWTAGWRLWDYTATAGGTVATLRNVVLQAITDGVLPLLDTTDTSIIGDPGRTLNPGGAGQRDLVFEKAYPRVVFQQLLQTDSTDPNLPGWTFAVWADKKLRLFPRDLTLKWSVFGGQATGGNAHTLTQANLFSSTTVPYRDDTGAQGWVTTTSDTAIEAILGGRRDVLVPNPAVNQAAATAIAAQFQADHSAIEDQGAGFQLGPYVLDAYGRRRSSLDVRPGDVIRIVDQATAALDLSGVANNVGNYWISEVQVSLDDETVACVPDKPMPTTGSAVGQVM